MVSVGDSSSSGLIAEANEIVKATRNVVSGINAGSRPETTFAESANEDQFGKFAEDVYRLEAVRIRERRLLIHGITQQCVRLLVCVSVASVLLFTDHAATLGRGFVALMALFRGLPVA
jgi:hypothetical protein